MQRTAPKRGLRSEHAYAAAFASIGLSVASWYASLGVEKKGEERADLAA
ncbi:hypothetical protein ACF07F_15565 [Streptomyces sp. NPDC015237]